MNSLSNTKPTINISYNFKFNDCNGKCESSPKLGSSWWKQLGYNIPCLCVKTKVNLNTMDSCSCCYKLVDYNIDDDIQCVGTKTVCLECYEKYYSDDEYNYDCGCSTQSTPYSYIMTKGIDMEATICSPCYHNRKNNEFHNWNDIE
tara:strand:- start:159 stop:596 length:438 start_codon:yes stop_codon:yes gene_type:complete